MSECVRERVDTCMYVYTHVYVCIYSHTAYVNRHGTWKRRRVYNEGRCSAVRRWLLNVLGRDYLLQGGCLDIAGGKGEFSFEVMNLNGVTSTVFDPRPLDLYRYKRKLEFGFFHRNDVLGSYNHTPPPVKGDLPLLPNHVRGFFEMFESNVGSNLGNGTCTCVSNSDDTVSEGVGKDEDDDEDDEFHFPLILRDVESYEAGLDAGQSIAWSTKVWCSVMMCMCMCMHRLVLVLSS